VEGARRRQRREQREHLRARHGRLGQLREAALAVEEVADDGLLEAAPLLVLLALAQRARHDGQRGREDQLVGELQRPAARQHPQQRRRRRAVRQRERRQRVRAHGGREVRQQAHCWRNKGERRFKIWKDVFPSLGWSALKKASRARAEDEIERTAGARRRPAARGMAART
jgi:hypothetical protein